MSHPIVERGLADKRRLVKVVGAVLAFGLFLVIQQWQTTGEVGVPTLPAVSVPITGASAHIFSETTSTSNVRATVVRAIDGDTLEVRIEGMTENIKVRLLGINTPESVDPRRPVQCFGKEASNYMKQLVEGKLVLLYEDLKADDRDKYGRWLRNVVRESDRLDVNATLINQGYASSYLSFPLDAKRKAQLRALEQEAKTAERGLWSPSTCEGKK